MNSNFGHLKSASKAGTTCALLLLLCLPPVFGLPFLPKKKPPAQNIPPQAQVSPGMMHPGATQSPVKNLKGMPIAPVNPAAAAPIANPVHTLVEKGIFPADSETRDTPFNRAELASILVKALGHNTSMFSEFPFYRDVLPDYWAYVPIEVAREKKLIEHLEDHGFYYPEKIVTYGDLYLAISHAITGPPPNAEITRQLLKPFKDQDTLSGEQIPAAAKLALVRFFTNRNLSAEQKTHLRGNQPVFAEGLAPFITYLMRLVERRAPLRTQTLDAVPVLPAGLRLPLSPATAIIEATLTPGTTVYFTLSQPVDLLPKGSRIRGTVQESTPASRKYSVSLFEAQTPEGIVYKTSGTLPLHFPLKEKLGFFVPGEIFEAVTQTPILIEEPVGPPATPQQDTTQTAPTEPGKKNPATSPALTTPTSSPPSPKTLPVSLNSI